MKRFLIMFLILGLAVGSALTAEAKKKGARRVERTVEWTYDDPYVTQVNCRNWGGMPVLSGRTSGCGDIKTLAREDFFSAKATDAHGQPVFVEVFDMRQSIARFCGETTKPIPFYRGADLHFYIGVSWIDPPPPECPAGKISTSGKITFTLSNRP